MAAAVLACDWGTTNLRAWTLDAGGGIVADKDFPGLGVSKLKPIRPFHRRRDVVVS